MLAVFIIVLIDHVLNQQEQLFTAGLGLILALARFTLSAVDVLLLGALISYGLFSRGKC